MPLHHAKTGFDRKVDCGVLQWAVTLADLPTNSESTLIKKILGDLRRHRNIDTYAAITAAFIVALLSFFELIPQDKIASLTLVVLAVIALGTIATRDAVEKGSSGEAYVLRQDFPEELRSRREKSRNTLLIGNTLGRTITTSYSAIADGLQRGHRLRVLVTSPTADDAAIDTRTLASRPAISDTRYEIERVLKTLKRLSEGPGGPNLEVRTTMVALKFGLNFVDVDEPTETLYVQHYSYRLSGESRPHLAFTRADREWFETYKQQAEALWADGEVQK